MPNLSIRRTRKRNFCSQKMQTYIKKPDSGYCASTKECSSQSRRISMGNASKEAWNKIHRAGSQVVRNGVTPRSEMMNRNDLEVLFFRKRARIESPENSVNYNTEEKERFHHVVLSGVDSCVRKCVITAQLNSAPQRIFPLRLARFTQSLNQNTTLLSTSRL